MKKTNLLAHRRSAVAIAVSVALLDARVSLAQSPIVFDGSVYEGTPGGVGSAGTSPTFAAGTYLIEEGFGTRAGANLFHSFTSFSVPQNQTARFTQNVTPPIANVISRVTGGVETTINGTVHSAIPGADFWFVNPAGVVVGSTGAFNVPGALAIGAADFIDFDGSARWYALGGQGEDAGSLLVDPESFGFLPASEPLASAGILEATGGNQLVIMGDLHLAGAAGVTLDGVDLITDAALARGSDINVSSRDGDIRISNNGRLMARTNTADDGGSITVATAGDVVVDTNSEIVSTTDFEGNAGDVTIRAGGLRVGSDPDAGYIGGGVGDARIQSTSFGVDASGNAGNILVNVGSGSVDLRAAFLSTQSSGANGSDGSAGSVTVNGGSLSANGTAIQTITNSRGAAGGITVDVTGAITLRDTAVFSNALGDANDELVGSAGDVWIEADGDISLLNSSLVSFAEYLSTAQAPALATASGGNVTVRSTAGAVSFDQSGVDAHARSVGSAGNVTIDGRDGVTIDGPMRGPFGFDESISSSASNGGRAGSITILSEGPLELLNGARLRTDVDGFRFPGEPEDSSAGAITLTTSGLLTIDRGTVSSTSNAAGDAGNIEIAGSGVLIENRSRVAADYNGAAGGPGSIVVTAAPTSSSAPPVDVVPAVASPGVVTIVDSGVTADNLGGDADQRGDISISGADVVIAGSIVTTDVNASGSGDNIIIDGQRGVWIRQSSGLGFPDDSGDDPRSDLPGEITRSLISARTEQGAVLPGTIRIEGGALGITVDTSNIDASTDQGGGGSASADRASIALGIEGSLAGRVAITDSVLNASTTSGRPAGNILVGTFVQGQRSNLNASVVLTRATVNTATTASGLGGDSYVAGSSIDIDDSDLTGSTSDVGDAGDIQIEGDTIRIDNGSTLAATTTGTGDAGGITVVGDVSVTSNVDAAGAPLSSAERTTITSESQTSSSGSAGSVTITGPSIRLARTDIRATTESNNGDNEVGNISIGEAGDQIELVDAQVAVTAGDPDLPGLSGGSSGAGDIVLTGSRIALNDGTRLSAQTYAPGDAGNITLNGGDVSTNLNSDRTVDAVLRRVALTSRSQRSGAGAAGTVTISGGEIRLANADLNVATDSDLVNSIANIAIGGTLVTLLGSTVTAETSGATDAGAIAVDGGSVEINDSDLTGSTSDAGDAGSVQIEGDAIRIDNGSTLAATTTGAGDAGDITVAGDVSVTSNVDSAGIPLPSAERITITSESQTLSSGSAGSVTITGPSIRLANADIRATTESNSGDNQVGNISIGEAGDEIELVDAHVAVTAGDPSLPDLSGGSSGAGDIVLTGSRIALNDGTRLNAQTYAPGDAGNITINGGAVSTNLNSNGTADPTLRRVTLTSRSERTEAGAAGTVTISGGQIRLASADVSVTTDSDRLNAIGNMVVDGTSVTILGSTLTAETSGATKAGDITIRGASVEINDSAVTASTNATGDAGNIEVSATGADSGAPALRVVGGATIRSDAVDATSRATDAGYVALRAALGTVSISGETPATPAEVSTAAGTSAGSAGDVEVTASAITLSNAELATTVRATAAPDNLVRGDIALTAGRGIQLTNTLLDARTSGVVDAGSVSIVGDSVEIRGGRQPDSLGSISLPPNTAIVTSTSSSGAAGSIVLQGDAILIEDAFVSSQTSFSGNAGAICIEAGSTQCASNQVVGAQAGPFPILAAELPDAGGITLENSTIATSTSGTGAAGLVALYGNNIVLQGGLIPGGLSPAILTSSTGAGQGGNVAITLAPNGSLLLDETAIVTSSLSTNGGNIQVNAQGAKVVLTDSLIFASAGANGRGGNVLIDRHGPTALHRSQIFATAVNNNGGNITLRREGNAVFVSDSQSIVNADSGFGVDGVIDIDSPDTDISAAIQSQDIAVTEPPVLAASACESTQGERSRFVVEGRGGVRIGVDEYQTASLAGNRESAASSSSSAPLPPLTATLAAVSAEEGCR